MRVQQPHSQPANSALLSTGSSFDKDSAQPLTGCCSTLSTLPCSFAEEDESFSACFDSNEDYTSTRAHATVSRDEVLQCMNSYHGLCLSDEQLDSFIETQDAIGPSVETELLSHESL